MADFGVSQRDFEEEDEQQGSGGRQQAGQTAGYAHQQGGQEDEEIEPVRGDGSKRKTCALCHDSLVDHYIVPCGHASACSNCFRDEVCGGVDARGAPCLPPGDIRCPQCNGVVDLLGQYQVGSATVRELWGSSRPDQPWCGGYMADEDYEMLELYGFEFNEEGRFVKKPQVQKVESSAAVEDEGSAAGVSGLPSPDRRSRLEQRKAATKAASAQTSARRRGSDSTASSTSSEEEEEEEDEGGPPKLAPNVGQDPRVDIDRDWVLKHGDADFMRSLCDGFWREYKVQRTGKVYFVNIVTGAHTFDAPGEVIAELRRLNDSSAIVDEYAYEGLDANFQTNGPWVPPSAEKAEEHVRDEVFAEGMASVCGTSISSLAALGAGVSLYFRLLKVFALIFGVMLVLAIPSLLVNVAGIRVPSRLPDPLGFSKASLGNAGPFDADNALSLKAQLQFTSSSNAAANGSIALNSSSILSSFSNGYMSTLANSAFVTLAGSKLNGLSAAYMISYLDVAASALVLAVVLATRARMRAIIADDEAKKVSAANYTVFVKGLPADTSAKELIRHFSTLFALDGSGVSTIGVLDVEEVVYKRLREGLPHPAAESAAAKESLNSRASYHRNTMSREGGSRTSRGSREGSAPTSRGGLDDGFSPNAPALAAGGAGGAAAAAAGGAAGAGSVIVLGGPGSSFATAAAGSGVTVMAARPPVHRHASLQRGKSSAVTAADKKAKKEKIKQLKPVIYAVQKRHDAGVVTTVDTDVNFPDRLSTLVCGPVQDISHNGDPSFLGSWVADVVINKGEGEIIETYLANQKVSDHLREVRAQYKMYSPGTPLKSGPHRKKQMEALGVVQKLELDLASLQNKLNAKEELVKMRSKCIGSAFITFDHEESYQRCLRAYAGSHFQALRLFQRHYLRFRSPHAPGTLHPKGLQLTPELKTPKELQNDRWSNGGAGWRLVVEPASDPSDIIHENLAVTSKSRCIRVTITNLLTLLLLVLGFVGMVVSQSYGKTVTSQVPDFSLCDEEIPALYLGGYSNVSQAMQANAMGYGEIKRGATYFKAGGPASFSDTAAQSIIEANSGSSSSSKQGILKFTRMPAGDYRRLEDMACDAYQGSRGLALRYDFAAVPLNKKAQYFPDIPVLYNVSAPGVSPTAVSVNGSAFATASLHASSAFYVGTAGGYGQHEKACSKVWSNTETFSPMGTVTSVANSAACPDPRRAATAANQKSGHCQCIDSNSKDVCYTLPCFRPELKTSTGRLCKQFPVSTISGCYCLSSLNSYVEKSGGIQGFIDFSNEEADVCAPFLQNFFTVQSIIIGTALSASVVNFILGVAIPALVKMEKHVSVSAQGRAMVIKLAAAQTVNTALTAVLVNARLPVQESLPEVFKSIGFLNGDFSDITTYWYARVGASICLTIMINSLIHPLISLLTFGISKLKRKKARERASGVVSTQHSMNHLYVGNQFTPVARYPAIITYLFVCMCYGSGMPVLYLIAMVAYAIIYFTDKLLLLRFNKKPASMDASLAHLVLSFVPWAVAVHLAVAIWTFAGGDILPSELVSPSTLGIDLNALGLTAGDANSMWAAYEQWLNSMSANDPIGLLQRVVRTNTLPQLVLLALLLVVLVLANVLGVLASVGYVVVEAITCGFICCRGSVHKTTLEMSASVRDLTTFLISRRQIAFKPTPGQDSAKSSAAAAAAATAGKRAAPVIVAEGGTGSDKATQGQQGSTTTSSSSSANSGDSSIVDTKPTLEVLGGGAAVLDAGTSTTLASVLGGVVPGRPKMSVGSHDGTLSSFSMLSRSAFLALGSHASIARGLILEAAAMRWLTKHHKPCQLDGRTTIAGKGLAPFTAPFSKLHDSSTGIELDSEEVTLGWRLQALHPDKLTDAYSEEALAQYKKLKEAGLPIYAKRRGLDPNKHHGEGGAAHGIGGGAGGIGKSKRMLDFKSRRGGPAAPQASEPGSIMAKWMSRRVVPFGGDAEGGDGAAASKKKAKAAAGGGSSGDAQSQAEEGKAQVSPAGGEEVDPEEEEEEEVDPEEELYQHLYGDEEDQFAAGEEEPEDGFSAAEVALRRRPSSSQGGGAAGAPSPRKPKTLVAGSAAGAAGGATAAPAASAAGVGLPSLAEEAATVPGGEPDAAAAPAAAAPVAAATTAAAADATALTVLPSATATTGTAGSGAPLTTDPNSAVPEEHAILLAMEREAARIAASITAKSFVWVLRKFFVGLSEEEKEKTEQEKKASGPGGAAAAAAALQSPANKKGQIKRTWQVISDTGLFSYDYLKHPVYKRAFLGASSTFSGSDIKSAADYMMVAKEMNFGLGNKNRTAAQASADKRGTVVRTDSARVRAAMMAMDAK